MTTGAAERDAGRVTTFLAVAATGLIAVIGLSLDGAGQLRSMQRADNLAAEAARVGGQQINRGTAIGGGGIVVDEGDAEAAIAAYIEDVDDADLVEVTFDTVVGGQDLTVVVDVQYNRIMLGLFGLGNTVTVRGTATALLRTDP
ncbi:hypothetical protein BDK92_3336 [Micromonospora pisi]|uniref:Flp pilus-assembly TadE/G-like protein n=1 Tax=Micromonospora pisi TaxID=589240 RepID=A0A495JKX6_9ACTN|nr:hypothetical protein [Micromonospora pisi]RKR89002.1 hypothetical protein BDK92_3336 [Micromonospora pisi]